MTEEVEQHDLSRLDAYARSRQKVAFLNAVWRPMAVGAVGAALVIGAVYVTLPKFAVREVVVDHVNVVPREVEVPKVTMRDVTADHVVVTPVPVEVPKITVKDLPVEVPKITITPVPVDVPKITVKDVPIELPRVVTPPPIAASAPVESARPASPATPSPRTPQEEGFERSAGWREAVIRGRILRPDGKGFILGTGAGEQGFYPAEVNAAGGVELRQAFKDDVAGLLGDLCACRKLPNGMYRCVALHQGAEVEVPQVPIGAPL